MLSFKTVIFALFFHLLTSSVTSERSFTIDYETNSFMKDGQPLRYIGGSLHYFQVPAEYWEDRLVRARAMGLNVIETVVMWNLHEPFENQFNFEGRANLELFLETANKLDLLVILRPGPYIDAEQEMGGFPAWLLKYQDIRLRTSDANYLAAVTKWFNVLLPLIKRNLYRNGGPVVMLQIENEYGSYYACDRNYTLYLRDLMQSIIAPEDVVYFTTDGGDDYFLRCGVIPDVYPTVDFGIGSLNDTMNAFKAQRKYAPRGPLVNSEFYPGWFDQWGDDGHHTLNLSEIVPTLKDIWQQNASFSFYPIHGGSNWDFQSGAEGDGLKTFSSVVTSYDYDAPISEAGDVTPKYIAFRKILESLTNKTNPYPVPENNEKFAYGKVDFRFIGTIFDLLNVSSPQVIKAKYPKTAENLDHPYGFILYETMLHFGGSSLNLSAVHDRGYVFVNGKLVDVVQRPNQTCKCSVQFSKGDKLQILVENQGRICYGSAINDRKGLVGNVTLDGRILKDWAMRPLNLQNIFEYSKNGVLSRAKRSRKGTGESYIPSFFASTLEFKPRLADTFFDTTGWGKGNLLVNGFNVGRYWPSVGPQVTLYLPKPFLHELSHFLLFELERPGNCEAENNHCSADFVDQPKLGNDINKKHFEMIH